MFQFVFYRAYLARLRAGDPHPLIGALVVWTSYVAAPLLPLVPLMRAVEVPWLPTMVAEHNTISGMVLVAVIYGYGLVTYVGTGAIPRLEGRFSSESESRARSRQVFLWVWPATMLLLTIMSIYCIRNTQASNLHSSYAAGDLLGDFRTS
jgi:hypothetical protein